MCSAGLLRSPTTALILSQPPFNFNTRAAGLDESHALIPVDTVLLEWAAYIVCMTVEQEERLTRMTNKPVFCLDIPDSFAYRDPELIKLIHSKSLTIFTNQVEKGGDENESESKNEQKESCCKGTCKKQKRKKD